MRPVFVFEKPFNFSIAPHANLFRNCFPDSFSFRYAPTLTSCAAKVILQVFGQVSVIQIVGEGIDNVSGNPQRPYT